MDTTLYILKDFKPFGLETTIGEIKEFFNATTYNYFPIVKDNKLIGLISETELQGIDEDAKEIGNFQYLLDIFCIKEQSNILEVLKEFASNQSTVLPVLNEESMYIGYYDLIDILHVYNDTPFFNSEGIVLLLEKDIKEYSLSEICQIIESNKGKVAGIFISDINNNSAQIVVKFDSPDINETIQSFRRYDYKILSSHDEDTLLEDLKDRSNYLQKYLNI